jgi:hypothetical protein
VPHEEHPLKNDNMFISTAGSKAGDEDFCETAMSNFNKKLDEYGTLHFADDIVNARNLPEQLPPIKVWPTRYSTRQWNWTRSVKTQSYLDVMAVTVRKKPTATLSPFPRNH